MKLDILPGGPIGRISDLRASRKLDRGFALTSGATQRGTQQAVQIGAFGCSRTAFLELPEGVGIPVRAATSIAV